ncbi:MAG: TRAP transporter large permease [Desulfomonile tiedjei]|uniref:TRAP transporter large permease n=1 Tax=Desulfomonile tiedjei TaxID=2358 RepID=A0A9D6V0B2_9BACT|nr:TRAP transporter large permease [Desulfomonile tiedjei]
MSFATIGILVIVLLFVFFLMGLEIGFSMALAGFIGFAMIVNVDAALNLVAKDIYSVLSSYGFTVISMFVFMGQVGASGGVARSLYDSAYKFMGHVPGGLAIGTVAAATAFKAICGSSPATAATFATIAVPEMDRYNYDRRLSCGTVATVGTLGILIPPSVVLIIYGILTETSIGRLFLAGIIPGLMVACSFVLTLLGWCAINPKLGPKGEKSTWKERFASLPPVIGVITIFLLVVGGLMQGFFTPTEAGSVGTFAVLVLTTIKKDMDVKRFIKSIAETLRIACMVLMLLAGATILGHFFAVTRTPYLVATWLGGLQVDRTVIVLIIIAVYLIGGSFIEDLAFLILATPIFLPVVLKLGYDPVWFGIIISVVTMIGVILPPMAINAFVVSGVAKVPINTVYKGIYPYIIGMAVCLLILLLFPQISLWLPNMVMK